MTECLGCELAREHPNVVCGEHGTTHKPANADPKATDAPSPNVIRVGRDGKQMDRRSPRASLMFLAAALAMIGVPSFPEPRPTSERRPPSTPRHASPESEPTPRPGPCPWHDADGKQCELGLKHGGRPWTPHRHADGWKERPESRQVRRARERAAAKALRRR